MNKFTRTVKNVAATTVVAMSAIAGTTAVSTTAIVTTVALSATYSSTAEAALICRDQPKDTRSDLTARTGVNFKYQPMKKSGGLFGKCKKNGGIKTIPMSIPASLQLPRIHSWRSDGCSAGGIKGKRLFHAACVAHDVCYATNGVSKFTCEKLFRKNLKIIASHGPVGSHVKAESFFTAVGVAGHSSYRKGQKSPIRVK